MQNHIPRLLLSATGSDSGKTTVMLALLSAFQKSGVVVQSYKSGPDYIDPMFHEAVTHRPAYHTVFSATRCHAKAGCCHCPAGRPCLDRGSNGLL